AVLAQGLAPLRGVDEGGGLVEDGPVARLAEVGGGDEGEPEVVVGAGGPVPGLRDRVPPVVDVAAGELVGGGEEEVAAAPVGIDREPDLRVLELVAEAVGAGLLVVAGAP